MKNSIGMLLMLCLYIHTATAQESKFTFGVVSPEDLKMMSYEKDTTANALILYERGDASIKKDQYDHLQLFYTYTVRIKIFNDKAFDEADIEIPLHKSLESKSKEKFVEAQAIAINPDRSVSRLSKNDIYTENYSPSTDLVKFTIPNITEGTIIDYTYTTKSPFFFNFVPWFFQSHLPKLHSEYHTSIPGNYVYNIKFVGPLALSDKNEKLVDDCLYYQGVGSAQCVASDYVINDIPAFKSEDYMISKYNYISSLIYELKQVHNFDGSKTGFTRSWKDADKEFKTDDIGRQSKKDGYFKKLIPDTMAKSPSDLNTAKELYYWLQKELTSTGVDGLFRNADVKDVFENKAGTNTELNLILLNFLKAKGYEANIMLLADRKRNLPTKLYPVISEFNAMVVKLDLDEKSYLLDVSDKSLQFGFIKFEHLNGYGRVMDFDKGSYWYDIDTKDMYSVWNMQIYFNLSEDVAKVREVTKGYFSADKRSELKNKDLENYLEKIENDYDKNSNAVVENYSHKNIDNPEGPVSEQYDLVINFDSDEIYLDPFIQKIFFTNPFKLEDRTYPVDFGFPFNYQYNIIIDPGDEYEIVSYPDDKSFTIDGLGVTYNYNWKVLSNQLHLVMNLEVLSSYFPTKYYQTLKKLMNDVVILQNKQPVHLKRKTGITTESTEGN
ncbi:DUF3857 domain-containing protein [Robertkochia solimangrovi]|uniref:DUF3857 domain-containing protein n=1 Tax=Robertkochia solimangrovi TaxID=2213046 RepID=UPI00117FBD98|nr:DUF3857 domain-containing protein [Robertkochia solimangrovi]TRZ45386.1 hypothetical protein DMZ48_06480 [Robertkochia solimangrovi]